MHALKALENTFAAPAGVVAAAQRDASEIAVLRAMLDETLSLTPSSRTKAFLGQQIANYEALRRAHDGGATPDAVMFMAASR